MSNTWFISDPHFGQRNIIKFTDKEGNRIRPFDSVEEHDETIIERVNAKVKPEDRLYVMGDVAMGRKSIHTVSRLNGRKKLIKGNHDIFKLEDYTPHFDDISSYRIYPDSGIIVSHIPVHPSQLEHRFKFNAHGHTHQNLVYTIHKDKSTTTLDQRYINLCLEHTDFGPVSYDELVALTRV